MARRSVPPALRRGPFAAGTALEHIGPGALRGLSYRRLLHGVYQAADLEVTHAVRIQAARVALGERAVLVGPSAAWALGSRLARPDQAAHVAVPGTGGVGQPLLVRHRVAVPEDQVVATPFGRATSADRTAVDLGRGTGTAGSTTGARVAQVDGLLRRTGLRAADARAAVVAAVGLHGIDEARSVMRAVRDGVDSPKETELRLLVVRHGFPEPQVQCPVDDGEVLLHLDLGWPEHRVGLEYDGAVHLDCDRHSHDLARHNRLRAAGWTVLQVDVWGLVRPRRLLEQLRTLLPPA